MSVGKHRGSVSTRYGGARRRARRESVSVGGVQEDVKKRRGTAVSKANTRNCEDA